MYFVGKKFCGFYFFHIHAEEVLIGVKKIFAVHENFLERQINFIKFYFQENHFLCGLIFTDFKIFLTV